LNKIYHLKTCSTCAKILKSLPNTDDFEIQDIKSKPLTEGELDELHKMTGSYEELFSRNATLYKERGLKDTPLAEEDYKKLILEHYTFLKRPVIVAGNHVFVGNKPATVAAAIEHLK